MTTLRRPGRALDRRSKVAAATLHAHLAGRPWYVACGVLNDRLLVSVTSEPAAWADRLMPEWWRGHPVGTVIGWWSGWDEPQPRGLTNRRHPTA